MPSAFDRIDFAPPAQPGKLRAMGLAVLAHLLLLGALTWGVNWKSKPTTVTVEAELWSSIPQQAAPRAATPPPPPPEPVVQPKPVPKPAPAPPPEKAPDIVEKQDKPPKKPVEKPPEKPPEPKPVAKPEVPKVDPAVAKLAAQKEAQRVAAAETEQREKDRQAAIDRSLKSAGSGAPDSPGTAAKSSGPSSGYASRVAARVKPNIVFTGSLPSNPSVEVDVRLAPDGTVLGKPRVIKSSGSKEWDEAVVRAIEKTEVFPRDVDGKAPASVPISARPSDIN
jgi:colicin import membrane protein